MSDETDWSGRNYDYMGEKDSILYLQSIGRSIEEDCIMPVKRELRQEIYEAEKDVTAIAPFTEEYPGITTDEAYEAQLQYVNRRIADGAVVKGKKIGLT